MFNSLSLNLKEKRQSNSKNMKTLRDNKRSLSRTMKLKTSSFKSRMSNLTRLYLKVNSESESKLSTGNLNTMKWKDNMPTFKVSWKKKKHFGKANLNSLKSKRIKLKKTMKMLSNNSSKQLTNSKDPRTRVRPSMSTTTTLSSPNLSPNSRKN